MLNTTNYLRNANQNYNEVSHHTSQDGHDAGEGMERRDPSYTVGENVNWCSHYGKQYEGLSGN